MEDREQFIEAGHYYEIVMEEGFWYEVWRDQKRIYDRVPWPMKFTSTVLMTREELVEIHRRISIEAESDESGKERG